MKINRLGHLGLLLCAFVLLAACSEMVYTDKYPPTSARDIEVVALAQLQKPYEIIGEITGNPVLEDMNDWKSKAARMGADAISIPERQPDRYVKLYALKWKSQQ